MLEERGMIIVFSQRQLPCIYQRAAEEKGAAQLCADWDRMTLTIERGCSTSYMVA